MKKGLTLIQEDAELVELRRILHDQDADTINLLRQIACLLSCHPRNLACQVQGVLECLAAALDAVAAGIFWPDASGRLQPRGIHPADFVIKDDLLAAVAGCSQPCAFDWEGGKWSGLAAPMRVGGDILGRLWVLAPAGRRFSAVEHEFVAIAANQLALALENARLQDEMTQLAERRGELLRRVIAAQDERCRRVSRELHDEISQSLTAMALDLEALHVAGQVTDERTLARLDDLRTRVLAALGEVNRIILDLRPTLLEDMGLIPALRWYAAQRLEGTGVKLHLRAEGVDARLDPHLETTLYRIGQEALTNIAKHAAARNVWLTVRRRNGAFELAVRDDGRGFDVQQVLTHPDNRVGIGLFSMKERATLADGTFELHSTPGQGTRIIVRIPVEQGKAAHEPHPCPVG